VQFFGNLATLMEVEIDTGKTHQIRVHAAHAGHPVAGDDKYGNRVFNQLLADYGLKRMFLHSSSMGFTRPGTREPMLASAPLPPELSAVIDKLTRGKAKAPQDERGKAMKPSTSSPLPLQRSSPLPPTRERSPEGRVREAEGRVRAPEKPRGRRAQRTAKPTKR
jgi:hypothetical protein